MDWLHAVVVDPYDDPQGWFAYLAVPVLGSAILAWMKPGAGASVLIVLWPVVSTILYFGLCVCLYGASSTMAIGVMFALVVYSIVCAITFGLVRSVKSGLRRSREA
jgi:hypothetical protein